jgi:predicted HD superfamily hydrolase involved in NAD metabolism
MSTELSADALREYSAALSQFIPAERVAHSENVCRAAGMLARRWAPELEAQAKLAGLLHDNAKAVDPAELLTRARDYRLSITPVEERYPSLLHGKVGAALLKERFGVDEPAVEQACADHVTGRKGMDTLSKILYVADQAAADRTFEGVEDLRAIMFEDLDAAVLLVAKNKVLHSARKSHLLEPATVDLYNSLIDKQLNG